LPVVALLWHRRIPQAHDFFRILILSEFFSNALSEGAWYPRWIPDMNGGYGYPLFVFYQPGYFYLSHLFSLVDAPVLRCALTLSVVALIGGLGAYRLIGCFAPPHARLFFLLMFQLTPYGLTEIYRLGHLTEWIALQLSPWPLYLLYRLARTPVDSPAHPRLGVGLAIALTAMCYAHPVTHVFFLPAFAAMACGLGVSLPPRDRFSFLKRALLGTLIAVILSSPYWLSVVTMRQHVNSRPLLGGHFDPLAHLLSPVALFWSEGDALSRRLGLSFELGPIHFILALAGVWMCRRDPFVLASATVYAGLLLLMTPAVPWFWSLYPFELLQFPWRLLAISAVFQLTCMLGIARRARGGGRREVCVAAMLVIGTALWHRGELVFRPMPRNALESPEVRQMISMSFPTGSTFLPVDVATPATRDVMNAATNVRRAVPLTRLATLDGSAEWTPITAIAHPLRGPRGASFVEPLTDAVSVVPREGSSKFRLDYTIDVGTLSTIVINQLYLPGWRVVLDGTAVPDAALRDRILADGRIAVIMGPGRHRLQAMYDGPPGWRWRMLAMLPMTGISVLWLFRKSRPKTAHL
jgi:hypothetical protein